MWYDGKNALFVDGPQAGELTTMKIGNENQAPYIIVAAEFPSRPIRLTDEFKLTDSIDLKKRPYYLLSARFPFVWCYSVQEQPDIETYDRAIRLIEMLVEQDKAETARHLLQQQDSRIRLLERQVAEAVRKINTVADNPLVAAMLELTENDQSL